MHPFLFAAVFIAAYMTVWFLIAQARRDNSIADVAWGLGFVLLGWGLYAQVPGYPLWLCGMVTLWGLRLAAHIGWRNRSHGEDWRYQQWRAEWGSRAPWMAFWRVFMLQGAFMWLVALPLMVAATAAPALGELGWSGLLGGGLWLVGWAYEAVADAQLAAFKADAANKGRVMRSGLWRYSRHPNYFGEILVWWGIFWVVWPAGTWWLSVVGPAVITWLLLRVSGVPMLEKKYEGRPDYQAYIRETPAVFPWPRG